MNTIWARVATLRIEWPSWIVQELSNVAADQHLTIEESQGHYPGPKPTISVASSAPSGLQLSIQEPETGWRYEPWAGLYDLAGASMILLVSGVESS